MKFLVEKIELPSNLNSLDPEVQVHILLKELQNSPNYRNLSNNSEFYVEKILELNNSDPKSLEKYLRYLEKIPVRLDKEVANYLTSLLLQNSIDENDSLFINKDFYTDSTINQINKLKTITYFLKDNNLRKWNLDSLDVLKDNEGNWLSFDEMDKKLDEIEEEGAGITGKQILIDLYNRRKKNKIDPNKIDIKQARNIIIKAVKNNINRSTTQAIRKGEADNIIKRIFETSYRKDKTLGLSIENQVINDIKEQILHNQRINKKEQILHNQRINKKDNKSTNQAKQTGGEILKALFNQNNIDYNLNNILRYIEAIIPKDGLRALKIQLIRSPEFQDELEDILKDKYFSKLGRKPIDLWDNAINKQLSKDITPVGKGAG